MRRALILAAALAAAVAPTAGAGSAAASSPAMLLGFSDMGTMQQGPTAERPLELQHLRAAGATSLRVMWSWSDVETTRPPDDASATDPSYAGYDFSRLDALLRTVADAGVEPLVLFRHAPSWWEGPGRPPVSSQVPAGTWEPDPAAFGRFMTAAARRYDGTYADPLRPGQTLPHVRLWQIWNEPNLSNELNPQWTRRGGRWVALSPDAYRRMLAAGYDGVKQAAPGDTVVTAGTAPFGDPPGGLRIQPARFVRDLLCVSGRTHPHARDCRATPAKFDVLAHHPYPIGPPGRTAINPDDVVVPDFAKITRPLKVALAAGNVYPRTRTKPVWATEMSWDTNPPDPGGLSLTMQARYAAGAIYVLWRQGVRALYWWNLRDDAQGPGYDKTLQSGVFLRGASVAQDTPKPSLTAFRFPFVAYRPYANFRGHGTAKLWGIAPAPGVVDVQRYAGGRWIRVATARAGGDHVFQLRTAAKRGTRLRAVQGGEPSIDAKVF